MSAASEETDDELVTSVTELHLGRPDLEMDLIGWLIFVVLLVLLIPLLPFVIILWAIDRFTGSRSETR